MARVLLVDDDANVCFALERILLKNGYDVMTACNGVDAMQKFQEDAFDLVLLDIFMPEKDGYETMMEMSRQSSQVPVIAMSGFQEYYYQALRNAKTLGALDVLPKPFSEEELMAALKKVLN